MVARSLAALLGVAIATACGGPGDSNDPDDPDDPANPDRDGGADVADTGAPTIDATAAGVEVGTGMAAFEAIGAQVPVFAGVQGGHHVFVNARIRNLAPGDPDVPGDAGNPTTSFAAFMGATQVDIMPPALRLGYTPAGDGSFTLQNGVVLQLDESVIPDIYGQTVMIRARVRDSTGTEVEDVRPAVAVEN